ncbi:MAG TPA: radical SAM protein [Thermoanaerobaculia bacterium]|nr:radical SAM protein [Thermoanaerobaculia bacterium]
MPVAGPLRVVLVKPSKYAEDGWVERFRWGFMPNSTLAHLASLTASHAPPGDGPRPEVFAIDEYVHTDLCYLDLLRRDSRRPTLLALVGVQSHQLHRALDLAALARSRGVEHCIVGGPHPMTCDTAALQGRGLSFALAEAEMVWPQVLADAAAGELSPVYGRATRWQEQLDPPPVEPPSRRDLSRYLVRLLGIYPARGCPYTCNFCSVIKIAGRQMRTQPVATTLASLAAARAAGVRWIIFTSDNFNKYPEVRELLRGMIAEDLRLPFFAQCDVQIERDEELVELMAGAGCFQVFVGAESFSREALRGAHKFQNHPERYQRIVDLCRRHGITSHFSNILGFPSDTEASIREHLRTLCALAPDVASFYLLTPIPGTDQYGDFLAAGRITEPNLDRYDGTGVTWRHPHLEPEAWRRLLFHCYREFYAAGRSAATLHRWMRPPWDARRRAALAAVAGYPVQSRLAARAQAHPMAGGVGRRRCDRAADYLPLRRETFGFDLAPLPENLPLSPADEALNRRARLPPNDPSLGAALAAAS